MTPLLRSGLLPLVALCTGLVGLGVLEYRWTDELARAEQDRLRAGMEAASVRFGDDLSREMARLLRAFRPAPWSAAEDQRRYARQVEEWKAEAADPGLLVSVLIARDEGGSWQLRRLDGDRLVDAEWALRAAADPRPAGRPRRDPPGPGRLALRARGARARGWPAPASAARAGPGHRRAPAAPAGEDAVLILVLDASILRSSVLPALAAHHFADLDADVAVVSGARGEDVIWSSRPGFPSGGDRGDVVTALLAGPPPFGGPRRGGGPRPSPGFGGSPPGSPGPRRRRLRPRRAAWARRVRRALGARRARRGGWSWRITPAH